MRHLDSNKLYYIRDNEIPGMEGVKGVHGKWRVLSGEEINKRKYMIPEVRGPIPPAEFFSPIMDDEDVIEREVQKERNKFRQLIADAIVRPRMVVPDSCAGLIGVDDLELAEERAVVNERRRKDMEIARKKQIEKERLLGPADHPKLFPDY